MPNQVSPSPVLKCYLGGTPQQQGMTRWLTKIGVVDLPWYFVPSLTLLLI
ncbi:MAG: hypothetical protein HXY43_06420 [Fischerella sp.]|nr:hypothetical protein [Fischerella sp.]NWF58939.1 hypothetical protein [Fischerella sp.]